MSKKALFVIAQKGFRDEELFSPKEVLDQRGIETHVAALQKGRAVGKLGSEAVVDVTLDEINVENYDALILVGGPGAAMYFEDERMWNIVRDFRTAKKLLAGICVAPTIMGNAGILIAKKVTAHSTQAENLKSRGADYTAMPLEEDDKIITAKGPMEAKEFGEKIAFELEK